MSPRISTSLAVFLLSLVLIAPSAYGSDTPLLLLPGHVESEPGKVSIYADYGSVQTTGRIPVYIVNRSNEDLVLRAQDGDIYLKLEFQDSSGNWIRAQGHWDSWCGNSYHAFKVRPGHYLLTSGYQPVNGTGETVRYRMHSPNIALSSNIGQGVVAERDIQFSAVDSMAFRESSFEYVSRMALSEAPVTGGYGNGFDARAQAIRALAAERFDAAASREVLLEIRDRRPETAKDIDSVIRWMDRRIEAADDSPD